MTSTDPSTAPTLFAVLLGGRAPGCKVELHDVAFAVGSDLDSLHEQLLDQWFGQARGLHVDAYQALDRIDGYRIELRKDAAAKGPKLYFINIGGYAANEFAEQHAYGFLAAENKTDAKQRARATLLPGRIEVHKDDLYEVDDCLALESVGGWHVHLIADEQARAREVVNGYAPLPKRTIDAWLAARGAA
ncbi:DUF1543 domain-containing protein [Wenzhouxiangella marina]|uniref:Uncharacterized protein n=1 Tax=Wenzhouxiangella marina TaxID=1579979 RepID=A0A0K0Y009_9GAMM|nr:DUF1543 domain-containing protein [Wenzhouxiangella marina]AKS43274.1 hypothetical protein WM2015_2917 [Wenzhouxiangella marina]MBB6087039.1 hypothetical protein [Wenzhouxiangella marina]